MKYTKELLEPIIKDSLSVADVIRALGLVPAGGNYSTIRNAVSEYNLDCSHFLGQGKNKGRYFGPKRDISEYLNNQVGIKGYSLKKRLLKEKYFLPICNKCKRTKWNDKSIPLELEHIDGNNKNNKLKNLELLCPNCHAQTSTYRGKNIGKYELTQK